MFYSQTNTKLYYIFFNMVIYQHLLVKDKVLHILHMFNKHSKVHALHMNYAACMTSGIGMCPACYSRSGNRLEDVVNILVVHTVVFFPLKLCMLVWACVCEELRRLPVCISGSHPRKTSAIVRDLGISEQSLGSWVRTLFSCPPSGSDFKRRTKFQHNLMLLRTCDCIPKKKSK